MLRSDLTPRQVEVLRLVAVGKINKEIARELNITIAGVNSHLHQIFRKLNVSNRMDAVQAVFGDAGFGCGRCPLALRKSYIVGELTRLAHELEKD